MEGAGAKGCMNPRPLGSFYNFLTVDVACAGLGKAASLGSLSVPPGWAMAAPEIEPISSSSSATLDATAEVAGDRPPGFTFGAALMATMSGVGAMTDAADSTKGEKDDRGNTKSQYAERWAQGAAAASEAASTLTPPKQPPQATNPAGQVDRARAPARAADPTGVTPVLQGQTATAPSGSTVSVGTGTTMHLNRGSVTVVGTGTGTGTFVENVPVTINIGSTVATLSKCHEGSTVIPSNTYLTATSSPITLTQCRHAKVVVRLVRGSLTTGTGAHTAAVITHAHQTATATVGAAGASITNIEGAVMITATRPLTPPACLVHFADGEHPPQATRTS